MRLALVLAATLLVPTAAAHAGACAVPTFDASVLSPKDATIDPTGGIVVGLAPQQTDKALGADVAKLDWTITGTSSGGPRPVVATPLAPGLAVLAVDPKIGKFTLRSPAAPDALLAGTATTAAGAKLAAPHLVASKHARYQGQRSSGESTIATLSSPPPAGVVAVLVYDAKATGLAKTWVDLARGPQYEDKKQVQVWYTGRCSVVMDGTSAVGGGDTIVVRFLDGRGHLSPASNAVTVAEAK